MASRTNLKDIAKKAGVHPSTLSLALRDHPRISEDVRGKVKAIANKPGYRVNPLVAALMQNRRTGKAAGRLVLAYVTNYPTRYCVTVGLTLCEPTLHRVAEDYYSSAVEAMEQMIQRGYKRIGFVFSDANDSPRVGERWLGAYLQQQLRFKPADRMVPFFYQGEGDHSRLFQTWFNENKPDALVVTHAPPAITWLNGIGVQVPGDVGVATLVNDHPEHGHAGVHGSAEKLGSLAVEMLVGLLRRGERGVPADPHEVLLSGDWRDGDTLLAPL